MSVTAITLFAGAGGFDLGFAACGVRLVAAFNHNKHSIATHALNFPDTEHIQTDLTTADPKAYPYQATILQASPECRFQSHARGVKLHDQDRPGLWTDREEDDAATRSRATMREVVRWTEAKREQGHPFQLIFVENVPKVRLWSDYRSWFKEMHALGYRSKTLYLNSMFAPSFPAPSHESRDRWYAIFWREGLPAPDLDIRPDAFCPRCARSVKAVQAWKDPSRAFGEYGRQYVYCCQECLREIVPFYHPAKSVLDWSLPTPPIGDRADPLVEKTLEDIQRGLNRYRQARTFILTYNGKATFRTVDKAVGTITTKDRHALITIPHPEALVEECGYRMLTFDEYRRAMGYPASFRFECSKTEALRQIGLSVTPAVAAMLVQRGLASLGYETGERSPLEVPQ